MKYFVNLRNMNKYQTRSNKIIKIFLKADYLEITKEEFEELEDIF